MTEVKECGSCIDEGCSAKGRRPDEQDQDYVERQQLARRMCRIGHKIVVLSGKGGVGKSTVAVNLAVSLSLRGERVGLLDIDIHGPSVPQLLNLDRFQVEGNGDSLLPIRFSDNLKVMSIGCLLRDRDEAVIWRGPRKYGVIKQFLKDVEWGDLDYLIIYSPPGTGDEPLSICQLIEDLEGAVIVTTPQQVALLDVRKSITFCKELNVPVLGVIENMSGFACPKCGEVTAIFRNGGADSMASDMGVPFLGRIPIDPCIGIACDEGEPHVIRNADSETAKAFSLTVESILSIEKGTNEIKEKESSIMRIAIPVAEGKLAMHFGHCEQFALIDTDPETKTIVKVAMETPPAHEPGVLPKWLAEKGANVIIGGGMGSRAQSLFAEQKIEVVVGAPADLPENIVKAYLAGTLASGENVCDH
ncbi:MAG: chromosome partitioning protein ParA [Lentisphaerales bacterium]|nr:MAG: chromosome partitioning protein ParA [Lentisphaerales bacterium]